MLALLAAAPMVDASPVPVPVAYFRDRDRAAPHNLYLRPARLPPAPPGSSSVDWRIGPAPAGGSPARQRRVRYPAASFDFRWSVGSQRWLAWMDHSALWDTTSGQLGPGTVVIEQVALGREPFSEDRNGGPVPIARTVGSGGAVVSRDGEAFSAAWSCPSRTSPTALTTVDGQPLPFAPGQTWILPHR